MSQESSLTATIECLQIDKHGTRIDKQKHDCTNLRSGLAEFMQNDKTDGREVMASSNLKPESGNSQG